MDIFTLLGLAPSLDIDPVEAKKNYIRLQSLSHPDNASGSQTLLHAKSAELNKAYKLLLSPSARAECFVQLKIANFQKQQVEQNPEFLLEMMDKREQLESVESLEAKNTFLEELSQDIKKSLSHLQSQLDQDTQDEHAISALLDELQFLDKLQLEAKNIFI